MCAKLDQAKVSGNQGHVWVVVSRGDKLRQAWKSPQYQSESDGELVTRSVAG